MKRKIAREKLPDWPATDFCTHADRLNILNQYLQKIGDRYDQGNFRLRGKFIKPSKANSKQRKSRYERKKEAGRFSNYLQQNRQFLPVFRVEMINVFH